jgi:hypothetical protein
MYWRRPLRMSTVAAPERRPLRACGERGEQGERILIN